MQLRKRDYVLCTTSKIIYYTGCFRKRSISTFFKWKTLFWSVTQSFVSSDFSTFHSINKRSFWSISQENARIKYRLICGLLIQLEWTTYPNIMLCNLCIPRKKNKNYTKQNRPWTPWVKNKNSGGRYHK